MVDHRSEQKRIFLDEYRASWKLHTFDAPVWLVEYMFDDSGPSDDEFDTVSHFVADYLGLTRDELRGQLDGCGGFKLGRPYNSSEIHALKESDVRISLSMIEPGSYLVFTQNGRYFLLENPSLREELTAWMIAKGAEIESLSLEYLSRAELTNRRATLKLASRTTSTLRFCLQSACPRRDLRGHGTRLFIFLLKLGQQV